MPRILARARAWMRGLFAHGTVEREMRDEMAQHLERSAERLVARGMTPEGARAEARREFGNMGVLQEEARDVSGARWLLELGDDLRYSARSLAHAPAFTISAALILALGIGSSIAVFSAVDAVLLAHLPYPDDEQLVRLYEQNSPTNRWTLSVVDYQAVQRYSHTLSASGAIRPVTAVVNAGASAERVATGFVTSGLFDALGVKVSVGRRFTADDERLDASAVAIISERFAIQNFGSGASALDRVVMIDGSAYRVAGVLAPDVKRLAMVTADVWPVFRPATPTRRGPHGLLVIGRMRRGVTLEAARRDLAAVSVRIFPEWLSSFQDSTARLTPYSLRETIVGRATRPLALFAAAVALVLLIAIANVASLSIVRGMRRWRELSMRSVLGASRARLLRLVLAESVVLAFVGAMLGLVIAWVGLAVLQRVADDMPRLADAQIGWHAVITAAVVSLIAGFTIGIVPAMRLLGTDRAHGIRGGLRAIGDTKRSDRTRAFFVAAEFALALPILAAGALLLTSFLRLSRVDPGFDPHGMVIAKVSVPAAAYKQDSARARFWRSVVENVRQIAGVDAVALSTGLPPNDDGNNNDNFDLVDAPVPHGGAQPTVTWPGVTGDFLSTLRLPLLEGRRFLPNDTGGPPVVIVTRAWANHYYPGRSAIGRELIRGGCTSCPHTVVVGVVGDVTFDGLGASREAVLTPLTEGAPTDLYLLVRSAAPLTTISRALHDAVQRTDPNAAFGSPISLEDEVYESVAQPRHWAAILGAFASAALLLASVGIFGLLSYTVALRRREIGVRMALGAPPSGVIGWLVAGGLRFAVLGAAIGLCLTVIASRWLRSSLYEVSALDPPILAAVTAGLLSVAALASWLPARRAANIDPLEAMRPD